MERKKSGTKLSATFKRGSICIAFLILGYQTASFMHSSAVLKIQANRDCPDTIYIGTPCGEAARAENVPEACTTRRNAPHTPAVQQVRRQTRRVETFRFNPTLASMDEFQRLGFSEKQAQSLLNYREKGGRFRRKSDFARSFVVADSVYRRLEKYIDIPLLDINKADSAAFDSLPGIGGYFAARMVKYRDELGGYSCCEQLMEIYHFDQQKFDGLKDLICCSPPEPFALWSLDVEHLRAHPHIRSYQTARAIVLFRENSPRDSLSVPALQRAGILSPEAAAALGKCLIAAPQ